MKSLRLAVAFALVTVMASATIANGATPVPAVDLTTAATLATEMPRSDLANESIYFVLPDRYANATASNDEGAGASYGGLDYTNSGRFHGGDLRGLKDNLQRIQDMGFTAIWISPVVLQKAVQGGSSAYHGYWGLDFTTVDPHFGTETDFNNLVTAAHGRNMKIYLDIVINHTADVISYTEGTSYVSLSQRYKDAGGTIFNIANVAGLARCTTLGEVGCFPLMNLASFPKTIIANELSTKQPAFLQDPTNYHNRGNVNDWGSNEQARNGDFGGLDDLMTENPEVIEGMAEVWANWVIDFNVDGFRIDTAKHVDKDFFSRWTPLVYEKVRNAGKDVPEMFGEIYSGDLSMLSQNVRDLGLQSVLDFPMNDAVSTFATGDGADSTKLAYLFNWDDYYNSGSKVGAEISNSYSLVTFAGNHDEGRIGTKIWGYRSNISSSALAQRINFAYGMLFTMRGAPVLYYGDEVGMLGDGGDKAARQDMFPTDVTSWRSEARAGSSPIGTADSLAITSHPIMNYVKSLGALRQAHPALTDGALIWRKVTTKLPKEQGTTCKTQWKLLITKTTKWSMTCTKVKGKLVWTADYLKEVASWSRIDSDAKREYVVFANSTDGPRTVTVPTSSAKKSFTGIFGSTASATANATGQLTVTVGARTVAVFKANASFPTPKAAVTASVIYNKLGSPSAPVISAKLSTTSDPLTVTFIYRANSSSQWAVLGSDDSPSFKMAIPVWAWNGGTSMQVAAITKTTDGRLSTSPKLTITK